MKVTFGYEELLNNLTDLALVVEDVMSSDDLKNVLFKFNKDGSAELIGINQLVTFKRALAGDSFRAEIADVDFGTNDYIFLQIKSKELMGYLNTYKALRRTQVEDVELTLINSLSILCKVAEKDLNDGQVYISTYNFSNVPVKPNLMGKINLVAPSDVEGDRVSVDRIQCYTSAMLPIMKNDTSIYGSLVFGDDGAIVAFNAAFMSFMASMLPQSFKGIKLSYRALSFIDKIFAKKAGTTSSEVEPDGLNLLGGTANESIDDGSTMVICKKLDKYLYIYSESTKSEAFIIYDSKLPVYEMTKKLFVKEHYFVLDRLYLRDILKRLSLGNENIEFRIKCDDDVVEVRNSKFQQSVPILMKEALDDYNQISFKILPDALNKAIIGSDDKFEDKVYVYFCPQPNGDAVLVFSDSQSMWFSALKVRPFK